jgi:glutathione S-transferase
VQLHYFPTSYWSRIVAQALFDKGVTFESVLVDIRVNATFDPAYLRLNPKGVVPTLVDGERVICDGRHIVRYVDEQGGPALMRPEAELWIDRLHDVPVMLFSYAVWTLGERGERSADILADKVSRAARLAAEHPDLAEHYTRKQHFFEAFVRELSDPEHVARERDGCRDLLDEMGAVVAGQEWLCGDFGLADILATSMLYRFVDLGPKGGLDAWSSDPDHGLVAYYERLRARPSFRQTFVDDPMIARLRQRSGS